MSLWDQTLRLLVPRFIVNVKESDVRHDSGLSVDVIVRFRGKDKAVFVTMDDGKCIAFEKGEEERITDAGDS